MGVVKKQFLLLQPGAIQHSALPSVTVADSQRFQIYLFILNGHYKITTNSRKLDTILETLTHGVLLAHGQAPQNPFVDTRIAF